jgi:adenosylcobinamide-GDP ribazoletransferase
VSSLRAAVAFLTPFGGAAAPTPGALAWFPLVGASIGAVLGILWWAGGRIWPLLVAGAVVVAADLTLTGMLHFDGLVDAADGLLPPLPAERRLEVMSDPHAGAFGVGAAVVVIALRLAALGSTRPSGLGGAVLLLGGLWCLSRSAMALVTSRLPYARAAGGGLATSFLGGHPTAVTARAVLGIAMASAMLVAWHAVAAPAVLAGALGGSFGVALLARRRIGGFTGDVLGAAGVVGETVGLLVAVARW